MVSVSIDSDDANIPSINITVVKENPKPPITDHVRVYVKDGALCLMDSTGKVTVLAVK
jgi:hypothetical protein